MCSYAVKSLIAVWNMRYNVIHCCANLLAGLAPYQERVAVRVTDGLIEDIRVGLEINHPKFNQRRMSCVKYLGELYNYRMVESNVIFRTLYTFINFGVVYESDSQSILLSYYFSFKLLNAFCFADPDMSVLDPPEHLLRILLVCNLLDTCAQYFDRGSSKRKLDCFLTYFQVRTATG